MRDLSAVLTHAPEHEADHRADQLFRTLRDIGVEARVEGLPAEGIETPQQAVVMVHLSPADALVLDEWIRTRTGYSPPPF